MKIESGKKYFKDKHRGTVISVSKVEVSDAGEVKIFGGSSYVRKHPDGRIDFRPIDNMNPGSENYPGPKLWIKRLHEWEEFDPSKVFRCSVECCPSLRRVK